MAYNYLITEVHFSQKASKSESLILKTFAYYRPFIPAQLTCTKDKKGQ